MRQTSGADVIVIGAGIIGAACARSLAAEGMRVLLVDNLAGGATQAGMGHLVCIDDNAAELLLSSYSLRLWRELAADLPEDCAWRGCGTLWLAETDDEMDAAAEKQRRLSQYDVGSEILTSSQVAQLEPALRPGLAGGLRVAGDGILYAPSAARWLASHPGITRVVGEAAAIERDRVLLTDGERLGAPAIVVANGLSADALLGSGFLRAKKGHLAITDRYSPRVHHQLVELGYGASAHAASGTSVAFNLQPRPTGQLFIGSSRQFDSLDPAVDGEVLAAMLTRARAWMPALAEMNIIRCWTGFRAATADGLPLLGPHPSYPGLWLALGHEGLGVTTALGSGAIIAAQIRQRRPDIDDTPFLPARLFTTDSTSHPVEETQ
ncbi:FAD-dependent oxidoreductase [Sodalis sp. dw_96]|uniref:NAD(P)/FAD-dependent oxidoreductase n=1 Tax=Sodalis sp. dw_96 TaxID=2719794 RepID=UPI001BD54BA8|nr:FAD-dependent oxidoreductase [Sodalis sp. dw_96]